MVSSAAASVLHVTEPIVFFENLFAPLVIHRGGRRGWSERQPVGRACSVMAGAPERVDSVRCVRTAQGQGAACTARSSTLTGAVEKRPWPRPSAQDGSTACVSGSSHILVARKGRRFCIAGLSTNYHTNMTSADGLSPVWYSVSGSYVV